jgi:hypothetical protein
MDISSDAQREILSKINSQFPQGNLIPDYVDYPGQMREAWVAGPINKLFLRVLSEVKGMPEILGVQLLLPDRPNIDSEEYFSFLSAKITTEGEKTYADLQLSYVGICATLVWISEEKDWLVEPPTEIWKEILQQVAEICKKQGVHFICANDPFLGRELQNFRMGIYEKPITVYDALFFHEYC